MRWLRVIRAQVRLSKMVREARESFECEQFRRRRQAALKGLGRA